MISFEGCKKKSDSTTNPLIGSWTNSSSGVTITVTFADGVGVGVNEGEAVGEGFAEIVVAGVEVCVGVKEGLGEAITVAGQGPILI